MGAAVLDGARLDTITTQYGTQQVRTYIGASYIFKETSPNNWVQQVKLIPNPPTRYQNYGMTVW